MKYMTLALLMVAPCLAQASQTLTGILSSTSHRPHLMQEVPTDLPHCGTVEDAQANPAECLQGDFIEVTVAEPGDHDQVATHDLLEAELKSLSGSLVRLTGERHSYAGGRVVFFELSLNDQIQVIASPQPAPLPCGNYNGICH